ncbi:MULTISPECIES: NAD(P)H-binding protein [Mesorhizobium]|uniref:NAD(P)H-binding protein n=1 Tax=Mesorhizobium TaxID=68287 RepID=UPI0003CDDD4E|nr:MULTISPECIES: NAD(P)H-binding protein [Mesorhizobium]ESY68932.1 nucleoside-diphosphate sugar epimerase [Mesorhizobium sp. LNHC232B00]WJI40600.1 NAD(P)H-binding protein [Mesorhizobium opportunistum]
MARVLVMGATGYLGSHMVSELKKAGHWVRALSRRKGAFAKAAYTPDDIFVGEATRPETLEGLCEGIDYVFSALGRTRQKDKASFWDVDYGANRTVLDLAVKARVRQFLFISVVRPDLTADLDIVAAREALVRDMAASGIANTVVRATGFFSDMDGFLDMAEAGRVWLLGVGDSRINPVHGADVAEAAIAAFGKEINEIEVGGPEVLSYEEIGKLAFEVLGSKPRTTHIPLWIVNVALAVLRRLNRRQYATVAFLARMMQHDILGPQVGKRHLRDDFWARISS